ncbi:MAG: hypothetical protein KDD89_00870 [Anaerolineales bacterium]|nr:hypothetical protein [Anaerolineales bacterium]
MSTKERNIDRAWEAIFNRYNLIGHDFSATPIEISAQEIKDATRHFPTTGMREVRILCKQDKREDRPIIFQDKGLFILPIRNGHYVILQGEGYVDIPPIPAVQSALSYTSKLDFPLLSTQVGNSEMQHLDHAYAVSILRTFVGDDSLVLTIRGRKYTPSFTMNIGSQAITVQSVQTEVDAGYEGASSVVLVEAKNNGTDNVIIRQLYYPYRQWTHHMQQHKHPKLVTTIFFERVGDDFCLWQFRFREPTDYNSIELIKSARYTLT